jgi:hypothetical protein
MYCVYQVGGRKRLCAGSGEGSRIKFYACLPGAWRRWSCFVSEKRVQVEIKDCA